MSDYSVQSRSREDVSQLLADLKGADTHCGYAIRDTHHLPRARPSRDAQLCTLPLRLPQADPPPTLRYPDDGLLDALDAVAADMAARKISFLNPTGGMVSTPFAPHKGGRDEGSILRRSTSQIVGTSRRDVSMGDPRRTARRLTWTDARDIAQALEHVHVFDIRDAMSRCGGIAPAEQRFKPDYSPVRRDDAVPASAFVCDAVPVPSSFSNLSNHHEGVPVFTLDSASRNAARRIAAQLLRHEAIHGDTSGLDVRARIGKMLKRRVTPRVAASVEGAAAAANVGQATPPRSGDTANTGGDKENANVVDGGVCIDRHVTTAGDALLVYLVTAQLRLRRQREALERVRLTKVVEIARLLKQSDVCVSSVPSKRVAAALRTLHRDAIGLIDATAHVSAADACVVFLETALGTQSPNTDTFTHNNTETCLAVRDDVDAAVSPNLATPNLSTTMSSIEEHPTHGDARGSGERCGAFPMNTLRHRDCAYSS